MGIVDSGDLEWTELEHGETQFRRKQLGEAADSDDLGCSLYELPAGRKAWPYHYHTANEEAMFVLAGEGVVRLDGDRYTISTGDYLAFPTGERSAHRVINNSDEVLRYLIVSEMNDPDITVYPDSEKFGVFVGSPPGGREERSLEGYYRVEDAVDFWEGE